MQELLFSAKWVEEKGDPSETGVCVSGLRFSTETEAVEYGRKAFGEAFCGVCKHTAEADRPF